MLLFLMSCLLSMDVSNEAASVSIENTGLPSCGQKLNVGMSSSVQIGFSVKDQGSGWGSGNYMKLGKYRFIITAAHVVSEGEIFIMNGDTVVPLKIVYNNPERDIAIVVPLGDVPATAKHLKINKSPDLEGTPTNYTGYPSDMGKSVYSGMVSKSSEKAALIQSFALPGSSGSVVFDNKGRAIGIVSAVKLLQNPFSPYPELVETVVYVERFTFINKRFLKEVFVSAATGE